MGQDLLVSEQLDQGEQLVQSLRSRGFPVLVAFWALPTEEGKWYLYLASPVIDAEGPAAAYGKVQDILQESAGRWIDLLDIRVIGLDDTMTQAVQKIVESKVRNVQFAVPNARPYQGLTQFRGETLGGLSIGGAYLYPPAKNGAPASSTSESA